MSQGKSSINARWFFEHLAEEALQVQVGHLRPETVLVQWALETDFGSSEAAVSQRNYAGISRHGRLITFPSLAAFVAAYENTLHLGWYQKVIAPGTPEEQMTALGESPWAASHYTEPGGAPGSSLIAVYQQYDKLIAAALGDQSAPIDQHQITVTAGETLSGIAQSEDVSLQSLEAANPQITDPNQIVPGEEITVPTGSTASAAASNQGDPEEQIAQLTQELATLRAALRHQFPQAGF